MNFGDINSEYNIPQFAIQKYILISLEIIRRYIEVQPSSTVPKQDSVYLLTNNNNDNNNTYSILFMGCQQALNPSNFSPIHLNT